MTYQITVPVKCARALTATKRRQERNPSVMVLLVKEQLCVGVELSLAEITLKALGAKEEWAEVRSLER